MNRRGFLRLAGAGGAATALVALQPTAAATTLALVPDRRAPEHLPPLHGGDILSVRMLNDIIARVNVLSDGAA